MTAPRREEKVVPPPPKEEQGIIPGLFYSLKEGAQQTLGRLGATSDVATGNNQGVVTSAMESQELEKNSKAQALKELKQSFKEIKKAPEDASLLSEVAYYTKEVSGRAWDNLTGTTEFIAEQVPNMGVVLGSGFAGAKAGAIAGTAVMPGYGTAIGGTVGFIAGMFGGNALLEVGGKAQEKASDGTFTDKERSEAAKEGTIKAGVITGVDVATLGASKFILGTSSRAIESATIKALESQGINAEKAALAIKEAQDQAVNASRGLDKTLAKTNFENATLEAAAREGLTSPDVVKAVQTAQKAAYEATNTFGKRIMRGGSIAGLETLGEGVGEYLGELAATGKSDVLGAVIEALAGAAQSATEVYATNKLSKTGTLTQATNMGKPEDAGGTGEGTDIGKTETTFTGTAPDSIRLQSIDIEKTTKAKNGVALLAALHNNGTAEDKDLITKVAERTGVLKELRVAMNSQEALTNGEQIISDDPTFAKDFMGAAGVFIANPPKGGKVKFPGKKPRTEADAFAETDAAMEDPSYLAQLEAEIARIRSEVEANKKPVTATAPQAQDVSQSTITAPQAQSVSQSTTPPSTGVAQIVSQSTSPSRGQAQEMSQQAITLPVAKEGEPSMKVQDKAKQPVPMSALTTPEALVRAGEVLSVPDRTPERIRYELDFVNSRGGLATWEVETILGLRDQKSQDQTAPVQTLEQQKAQAMEDLKDALGDLTMLATKDGRLNIVPEQEQKLMPILIRMFDAAAKLGYVKYKEASKFVLDMIRSKFGEDYAGDLYDRQLRSAYNKATADQIERVNAPLRKQFAENQAKTQTANPVEQAQNEARAKERTARVERLKSDSLTIGLGDRDVGGVVTSADGKSSRFERTVAKAEKGDDVALESAERYIAAAKERREAQRNIDNLNLEVRKAGDTPNEQLTKSLSDANTKFGEVNQRYNEITNELEGGKEVTLPKNYDSREERLMPSDATTVQQVIADRKKALDSIQQKILAGDFVNAEMEWKQYSNTVAFINSKIGMNKERIDYAESVIEEQSGSPNKDQGLVDRLTSRIKEIEKDNRSLEKNRSDAKNEFKNFLISFVADNPDSNLNSLVQKYVASNARKNTKDRSFLGKYTTIDFYRGAINQIVRDALNENRELTLSDLMTRPASLSEGLTVKQKAFLNALLDQTSLADVKSLYNEYKAKRDEAEANRPPRMSPEGEKFKAELNRIVNGMYEPDTYKTLIQEYRARLDMIYRAINNKPEPGDIDFKSQAGTLTEFDPSIAQDVTKTSKQMLMQMARDLDSDIREAMDTRIESLAKRYNLAADLIASNLYNAKAEAMNAGVPMNEVNEAYNDAMRSFIVGIGYTPYETISASKESRKENKEMSEGEKEARADKMNRVSGGSRYAPTLEQLFGGKPPAWAQGREETQPSQQIQDIIQNTPLDAKTSIEGLVEDIKAGRITEKDALNEIRLSIQDGDFKLSDVKEVFNKANRDLPADFYGVFSNVALNYTLEYWVKKNGGGYEAKDQWLTSYHNSKVKLGKNPDYKEVLTLEPEEEAEYQSWLKEVKGLNSRRNAVGVVTDADVAVLDKFLFSKYTLDQLKNPSSLPEKDQALLKRIGLDQLVREWHRDIEYAMRHYPDLQGEILSFNSNENARVKGQDAIAHAEWMQEVQRRVEDSIRRDKESSLRGVLGTLQEMGGITSQQYEEFYTALTLADMNEAQAIIDNAIGLSQRMLGETSVTNVMADHVQTVMQTDLLSSTTIDDMNSDMAIESFENAAGKRSFRKDFNVADIEDGGSNSADLTENIDGNLLFNDENYSDDYGTDRLRQGAFSGVVSAASVDVWVRDLTKDWEIAPNVQVVANPRQLPEPLRSRVMDKLAGLSNGMGAKGFFDGSTGNIYLFSDYIVSKDDTEFTLFHEAYGHLGMRGFLGKQFDAFLESTYKTNSTIRRLVDSKVKDGMGRLEATEEVLADANTIDQAPSAVKAYVGKVLFGLRKLGFTRVADWLGYVSNAELSYVLSASREWAKNADYQAFNGAPDVIRLNEAYLPYEIFSMRGKTLHAYARFNPITNDWYVFTAPQGDIRNNYSSQVYENYEDVLAVMQKYGKMERRRRSGFYVDDKIPSDFVEIPRFSDESNMKQWLLRAWQFGQNEYLPVFRLIDHLKQKGRLGDFDLKTALTLYERKTGVMLENFQKKYVTPINNLLEEARKNGASEEIVNQFLVAQTAEERNKAVLQVSPKNPYGSGMAPRTRTKIDGSVIPGYLDILERVEDAPFRDQLYEIGKLLDKMGDAKVDYEVSTGLIKADEGARRKAAYKHYRNLSGVNEDLDADSSADPSVNVGKKFNVKGKDKRALGRGDIAPDVLARTLVGFEASLIRGQKNLVAQKVLALLETNYDPSFVSINEQAKVQKIGSDGFVQLVEDPLYINKKDVMVAKVGGIPVTIRFKESGTGSVAEALHGMVYPPEASPLLSLSGMFNRTMGAMMTTWNALWVPVNFVRDIQTMYNNAVANGKLSKGSANAMIKALPAAMHVTLFAAINDINVKTPAGQKAKNGLLAFVGMRKPSREMYAAYLEAKKEGGLTSFINRNNLEDQIIDIERAINGPKGIEVPIVKIKGLLKFLELVILPLEMAPRVATYKVARDPRFGNMSKPDAAVLAGEITVNFNMRGSGKELRQLYLFFNPAVQGTAGMIKLAYNNKGKFAALAGAWMTFGMMMNMLSRALSGEDDDGINKIDKLPVYKRGTSIVIRADKRGEAIPLPYGWNALYATGYFPMDSLMYGVPWSVTAKRIAATWFEAFSPVGGSIADASSPAVAVAKTVAPTFTLPMLEWMLNENRHGSPIYKDDDYNKTPVPDTQKAFRSVSPISKWTTDKVHALTGGNPFTREGVDINPALIDHMVGSYLPGTINEAYKLASTAARQAKGLDVGREKEPLFDRFSAYVPEMKDAETFRKVKNEMGEVINEMKNTPDNSFRKDQLNKKFPNVASAWEAIQIVDKNLRTQSSQFNTFERQTEVMRLSGTITPEREAELIVAQNQLRANTKALYKMATQRFIEAGFRDRLVSGN
jgi:hypothetical protein